MYSITSLEEKPVKAICFSSHVGPLVSPTAYSNHWSLFSFFNITYKREGSVPVAPDFKATLTTGSVPDTFNLER